MNDLSLIIDKLDISEQEKSSYIDYFKNNPTYCDIILDFYKRKQEAIKNNNKIMWQEIIFEECKLLEKIEREKQSRNQKIIYG